MINEKASHSQQEVDMDDLFVDKMVSGGQQLGITFSDRQIEQFFQYYQLLIEWNRVMNLTAITEMEDVVTKHFIDSLSLVHGINMDDHLNRYMIDVGSGAGFPGIPLKICFSSLRVTLLDSLNKRIQFLQTVIHDLELDDIAAIHGRSEDFGRNIQYREKYDYCVSRAVANMSTLSEYCIPFVKCGGYFIAYKSGNIDEELKQSEHAIDILGGKIDRIIKFQLSNTDLSRSMVMIKKTKHTLNKYPRKAGVPSKSPLL